MNYFDDNGDLVVVDKTTFRQVGWLINGGPYDGLYVHVLTDEHEQASHGSFSPVYIEVGD